MDSPGTWHTRERLVLLLLVALGIALRIWAYSARTSLWLDEVLLSRNILELPLRSLLTEPLRLDQVAPRGFLLVEWLATRALGRSELALRLVPILCAIASVFLFRRLAERMLRDTQGGWGPVLAVAVFAFGVPFIKYGAEVKQYSMDVTATIALLLLAVHLRERDLSLGKLLLIGSAGFLVIWFSQASVLVMAGLGLALAVEWLVRRDRRAQRAVLVVVPLWAASSIVAIVVGIRSMTPATREFMEQFWGGGFLPLPFTVAGTGRWLWAQLLTLPADPYLLRYRWPALTIGVAAIGLVTLWRRRRDIGLLIAGPLIVAFAAAAMHQYPFRGRLSLYLLPLLLLAFAAGVEWLRRMLGRAHPALGVAAAAALMTPPTLAFIAAPPPYDIEHTKALLAYFQQHREPGDVIYLYPTGRVAATFYAPQFGIRPTDLVTGICDRFDVRPYIKDIDRFRGTRRFWVLSTGARPFRPVRATMDRYLQTVGVRREFVELPSLTLGTTGIARYDLGDSTRWRAATAETFPVPPMSTDPRPGCRPWTRERLELPLR
jgi:hypothetical protein